MSKTKTALLYFTPPLVFLGIFGLFFVAIGRENADNLPSTMIGREAPALTLTPLGAFPLLTSEILRTPQVKLVNFWASWCSGCRLEHPTLVKMAKAGGVIYGIDYKDNNGLSYLESGGNPFVTVSQDKRGRTAIDWGVYGMPETFVVDANGIITHRHIGAITDDVMEKIIMPEMVAAAAEPPTLDEG